MHSVRDVGLVLLPPAWPKVPPPGVGALQAYLRAQHIGADIIDLNNLFFNRADARERSEWLVGCNPAFEHSLLEHLRRNHADHFSRIVEELLGYSVLGFSCFRSNWHSTLAMISLLRERGKSPRVLLGGPEIARRFFKDGNRFIEEMAGLVDHLVIGEGERGLHAFLEGRTLGAPATCFSQLDDLGALPFPRYDGLDVSDYPRADARPLLFSRGCVRSCRFCAERLLFQGFRCRRAGSVVEEMDFHLRRGARQFVFFDSLLNGDLEGLEALCAAIRRRFGAVAWEAQIAVRPDMDPSLLRAMKESGCYNLFIGLESGAESTLRRMNKGFSAAAAEAFFRRLNDAGLTFGISLITGYPGETAAEFQESLDFVVRNRALIPKIEQINPFSYYDGTAADPAADYRFNDVALERMGIFVSAIKECGFKYTKAFIGNLVERASYGC